MNISDRQLNREGLYFACLDRRDPKSGRRVEVCVYATDSNDAFDKARELLDRSGMQHDYIAYVYLDGEDQP